MPIHDLGRDAEGRAFFTMRLVRGRDLARVYQLAAKGEEGWTRAHVLEVLLKVCDTMAFAHARGVIHRDLKPANVMVGDFGEVYVVDWGLAREVAREDVHDLRLRPAAGEGAAASREPDAAAIQEHGPPSPLVTMDGVVLGTPYFMAPEQAEGRVRELDARADVYSVGAMLYHLLAGSVPYSGASDHHEVLARVRVGPPAPLSAARRDLPPELVAICDQAMRRDPARRYHDMQAMASDLRAYLEGRVVRAHQTGAWAELSKWIGRNRGLTASIAAAVLVAVVGLAVALLLQRRANQELLRLVGLRQSAELERRFTELWPPRPERIGKLRAWVSEAEELLDARPRLERELAELRERALPHDPDAPLERAARAESEHRIEAARKTRDHYLRMEEELVRDGGVTFEGEDLETVRIMAASLQGLHDRLRAEPRPRLTWSFDEPRAALRHDFIAGLMPLLERLAGTNETDGLLSRARRGLEHARSVEQATIHEPDALWRNAIEAIADPARSPAYGGLEIRPQLGLLPLGPDPRSGLWEFVHLRTGEPARRDARGELVLGPETGVVLVLIPGGQARLGAQRVDPAGLRYDPHARPEESPFRGIRLEPYFLSKYELTQAQWLRAAGTNPSMFPAGTAEGVTSMHPVEQVDWQTCDRMLLELDLLLPSEAQWDRAARAGTESIWSFGNDTAELVSYANVADRSAAGAGGGAFEVQGSFVEQDDGRAQHAPVGSYLPNAFGLHDVHGNVAEWGHDRGGFSYSTEPGLERAERNLLGDGTRTIRGGSFTHGADGVRSASRARVGAELAISWVGVRPSREIDS